ncbi:hypothetical protein [Paraburkholderia phenoliruptrix]|uniref:hypothetical protein n=1 Tax=Paraburkholderia phenoliruptrix TaxID=252970 RepID=UPI002869C5A2|nr:hypothetical protein [Paraburkholderia phenoliruptrix]WMY06827.1 hypothetical protein P3F88_11010 [Paraburkholderia phenoliruptrix]
MTTKKPTAPPSAGKQTERALDSTDSRLDEALEESFPASDPIAVHDDDAQGASKPPSQQPVEEKKQR